MVYFLCKAYDSDRQNCYFAQSLPVRGAWIEMGEGNVVLSQRNMSLPVRGAWIEMRYALPSGYKQGVAPRAGSVD